MCKIQTPHRSSWVHGKGLREFNSGLGFAVEQIEQALFFRCGRGKLGNRGPGGFLDSVL